MPQQREFPAPAAGFTCQVVPPDRVLPGLAEDVRSGLLSPPRGLAPKYFYDAEGSRLFDAICDAPEYYVMRHETALLQAHAPAIIKQAAPEHMIELGSGASRKTRYLLDACHQANQACAYWPFDVCEDMLRDAGGQLMDSYPWLSVNALVGDYHAGLGHLASPPGRKLFVFLGGTIGNLEPRHAITFLSELRGHMAPGDYLLLGADRVKDRAVLEAAYNDAGGATARFNLNLLNVLNRELGAGFQLNAFRHRAVFNAHESRIEMQLIPQRPQVVTLAALGESLSLEAGETILTEISRKFTAEDLQAMLAASGLALETHFQSDNAYFSLALTSPC